MPAPVPLPPPADGGTVASGFPCEVVELLQNYCVSCHANPPRAGAPVSLLSLSDLSAPAPSDGAVSVAEAAAARMRDSARPMPPAPATPVPMPQLQAFEAWVQGGMASNGCGSGMMPTDPFDTPTQCSSGEFWTGGDDGNPRMHPGRTCVSCHEEENRDRGEIEAPPLWIGGTVYPTAHEPDDCLGAPGPATVEITDADGTVFELPVNRSGNFRMEQASGNVTFPVTAVVFYEGRARAMPEPAPHGNCNACHTEQGTEGAPGRIVLP